MISPSTSEKLINFSLEESNLLKNNRQRPGEVEGFAYLDVSSIHTLAQSHLQRAARGRTLGGK